jgi:hypothetical protein
MRFEQLLTIIIRTNAGTRIELRHFLFIEPSKNFETLSARALQVLGEY